MECPRCNKTPQVMAVEVDLIKKHIDKHKEYNNILSDDDAVVDFVDKFAWIMREAVCAFCSDDKCEAKKTKEESKYPPEIDDLALMTMIHNCESDEELVAIELNIIKRHISEHKWYNEIITYSEAIKDFLQKYAWVIRELRKAQSKIS